MDMALSRVRAVNRRPVVLMAVALAVGIVLGRFLHLQVFYFTAAVVLAAAAVCFFRNRLLWFAAAIFLLAGAALSSAAFSVHPVETGKDQTVTGRVYTTPYDNGYGSLVCLLDDASIDGQACGNIRLYAPVDVGFKCGDVVSAVADTQVPAGVRNPGGFDERLHLLAQGVHYKAYALTVDVTDTRISAAVVLENLRAGLGETIEALFAADTAPVVRGMLLGDKYGIDEMTYTAFRDSGMAHVLAVSGLHAGILIAAVYGLLSLLRLGRTPKLVVSLVFIVVYACVAGLTPSILRASIMAVVLLVSRYMGRQTDTLSNLSLAFILSLILNPLDLFTVGFQLSFGAVFGILSLGWQLQRVLVKWLPAKLGGAVAVSVGATAGTLPVTAAAMGRVSLLGLVSNIVVLPLASLAIVLSFITVALGLLIGQAAQYVGFVVDAVIRLMLGIIRALGALPFAAMDVATPPWYMVLVCYGLLFVFSKYLLIKPWLKAVAGAMLAGIVAAIMVFSRPPGMYMVFLDVGQGDAAFVRTVQGGEYFFDGGREQSAEEVVSFAVRQGITPDAAFVSHTDSDHFAGLLALYEAGLLGKVYCSYQEEEAVAVAMPDAQVVPLGAGDTVLLDDVTKAVVLYPYKDARTIDDMNEMSLVLRIEYGAHSVLLTGDISGITETELFCSEGSVDIYKAAHHGSRYSSYRLPLFVLRPAYSVISVGGNAYGHPHPWAVQNLEDYSGRVLITQEDYAVEFYIHDSINLNTYGGKDYGG